MLRRIALIFMTLLFVQRISFSQTKDSVLNIFLVSHQNGFVIPVINTPKYYVQSRMKGIDFYFGKQDFSKGSWSADFRYADYGPGFKFNSYDQRKILGDSFTFYYRINIPFYTVKNVGVYYSTSIGTSILTRPFQSDKNYLNKANGSTFNVYANFGVSTTVKILRDYFLLFGLDFYHISNGNIKLPNDGLNLVHFNTGLGYSFNRNKSVLSNSSNNFKTNKRVLINFSFGTKQLRVESKNYMLASISSEYKLIKTRKRSLGFGIDFIYDRSYYQKYLVDSTNTFTDRNFYYNSVYIYHSLDLNRFMIRTDIGYYLDYNNLFDDKLFYYLGLRYFLSENLFCSFGIKAKLKGGDYIAWGVGFAF